MFLLRDCITRSERDLTPDTSDLMALHLLPQACLAMFEPVLHCSAAFV